MENIYIYYNFLCIESNYFSVQRCSRENSGREAGGRGVEKPDPCLLPPATSLPTHSSFLLAPNASAAWYLHSCTLPSPLCPVPEQLCAPCPRLQPDLKLQLRISGRAKLTEEASWGSRGCVCVGGGAGLCLWPQAQVGAGITAAVCSYLSFKYKKKGFFPHIEWRKTLFWI